MFRIEVGNLEFEKGWQKDLLKQVAKEQLGRIRQALVEVRCPLHNELATVKVSADGDEVGWDIHGCCDKLRDLANDRLVRAGLATQGDN